MIYTAFLGILYRVVCNTTFSARIGVYAKLAVTTGFSYFFRHIHFAFREGGSPPPPLLTLVTAQKGGPGHKGLLVQFVKQHFCKLCVFLLVGFDIGLLSFLAKDSFYLGVAEATKEG